MALPPAIVVRFTLGSFAIAGCAQGYTGDPDLGIAAPIEVMPAPFLGDACTTIGDRVPCPCPGGFGTGLRACTQSEDSPTGAALSSCLLCEGKTGPAGTAAMASGGTTAAGRSGASGASGAGGIAAAAGSGGGGATSGAGGRAGAPAAGGKGGAAGAGTGGSAGTPTLMPPRPTSPVAPASSVGCECTQSCFPFGILPCCRQGGGCGCTWAPGAYCL